MKKFIAFTLTILYIFSLCFKGAIAGETLTWQDCVKEAEKNHPDLISAGESIKEYRATGSVTASAILPQLSSSVDVSRSETTSRTAGRKNSTISDSYSYGVTGTQLLFDGFKTYNDMRQASENIKAARHNYNSISSEVRLRLRTAFVNLLKTQELLNITEEIRKIRKNNLGLISLRYDSGIEHKGAFLTAEANLAQAELEINQTIRTLEVAQRELLKEMGRAQFSPVAVEGAFKVSDAALEKPDFEALAGKNPSIEKLAAQTRAAYFGIKTAEADFFPELTADVGASRTGVHSPPINNQWNIGLALSFPLFDGGLMLAELAKAKAIFNQAHADERSAKDGIIATQEQNWAALKNAAETVEVQKKFLAAAEERAKIAEEQYSLGLIQFDNWAIIEDALVTTKKAFLDAQANALLAEADWVQAKGETLEYAE